MSQAKTMTYTEDLRGRCGDALSEALDAAAAAAAAGDWRQAAAGLVSSHDFDDEYGIDADDLGADHSLAAEPTVARLRAAAAVLDEDLWIAVRLPGGYEGADDASDTDVAITRWTTVVLHPDELGWLREALAFNATDDEEDELEPL